MIDEYSVSYPNKAKKSGMANQRFSGIEILNRMREQKRREAGMEEESHLRECSKCRSLKPLTEFYRQAKSPDGLNRWCKACSTESKMKSVVARREKREKEQEVKKLLEIWEEKNAKDIAENQPNIEIEIHPKGADATGIVMDKVREAGRLLKKQEEKKRQEQEENRKQELLTALMEKESEGPEKKFDPGDLKTWIKLDPEKLVTSIEVTYGDGDKEEVFGGTITIELKEPYFTPEDVADFKRFAQEGIRTIQLQAVACLKQGLDQWRKSKWSYEDGI